MSACASEHAVVTASYETSLRKVDLQRKVNGAKKIVGIRTYSFYIYIPSELQWQRLQSWSGGTKDVGQPRGQAGETAVCLKAGRTHVALIPTLGVAA